MLKNVLYTEGIMSFKKIEGNITIPNGRNERTGKAKYIKWNNEKQYKFIEKTFKKLLSQQKKGLIYDLNLIQDNEFTTITYKKEVKKNEKTDR